jgi:anti-sigma factor RsiW
MTCHDMSSKLPDLLFEADGVADQNDHAHALAHLAECEDCRKELEELRATMALMDVWKAPEPNPYFLTRLRARLDEERSAAPVGWPMSWYERLRARLVYGSRMTLRPVAAMAMTVLLLVGGGAYLGYTNLETPPAPQPQAAVVHDLQTLDNNAQLLDQLETMSTPTDQDQD